MSKANLEMADAALIQIRASAISGSIGLTLRWLAKALSTNAPVEAFISYFVGLEALVDGFFDSLEPSPVRKQAQQLREYLDRASPRIDDSLKAFVLERVIDFPLSAKFDRYIEDRFGRDEAKANEFRALNRLRGELLHGKLQNVTPQQLNQVRRLLEECLAKELLSDAPITARHQTPAVLQALLRYALLPHDP